MSNELAAIQYKPTIDAFINSGFVGNFDPFKSKEDLDDLIEVATIAEDKKLFSQAKNLRRRILGIVLNKNRMSLMDVENRDSRVWAGIDDRYLLHQMKPDGSFMTIAKGTWSNGNPMTTEFRINDISDYSKPIPTDIIRKIPGDLIDKAQVFYPVERKITDPIIFIRVSKNYKMDRDLKFWAIGLYQWD